MITTQFSHSVIPHAVHHCTPGRTPAICIKEASHPFITVESLQLPIFSRPGPVIESGNGGFRNPTIGKYFAFLNNASCDKFKTFSQLEPIQSSIISCLPAKSTSFNFSRTPGRKNAKSIKEAPYPIIAVEPLSSPSTSRPGPAHEFGEWSFRNPSSGKYSTHSSNSVPVNLVTSSRQLISRIVDNLHLPSKSSNSTSLTPGRKNADSIEEALYPIIAVEPLPSSIFSRPGPAYDSGEWGFRTPTTGKYFTRLNNSAPDKLEPSSRYALNHARSVCTESPSKPSTYSPRIPGRNNDDSIKEAFYPIIAVEPPPSSFSSRPGPVNESGEEGFRTPTSGKFVVSLNNSPRDTSASSSRRSLMEAPTNLHQRHSESYSACVSVPEAEAAQSEHFSRSSLRIYYQNVRGLRTKIDSFFLAAVDSTYDVIVLTETWLDDSVLSTLLFGSSFTVFRMDRNSINSRKTRGGGVLIAVASNLSCSIDPAPVSNKLEQIWVKIKLQSNFVSIGVLYLPPDRRDDQSLIQQHIESIDSVVSNLNQSDIVIQLGDYNHPELHWTRSEEGGFKLDASRSRLTTAGSLLFDGFCFHGLTQMNSVLNCNSKILDLVMVNDQGLLTSVFETIDSLVQVDAHHPALVIAVPVSLPTLYEPSLDNTRYDFRRADFNLLNDALSSIDWQFLDSDRDLDVMVHLFSDKIRRVIDSHIPLQRPPPKPPWTNNRLRKMKRLKRAALRNYRHRRSLCSKRRFALASTTYKRYNHFLYARYVDRMQRSLRTCPKKFWNFVRTKRKEDGLPTSMNLHDLSANTPASKCELFAQHFKNAFSSMQVSASQIDAAIQDAPANSFDFHLDVISDEQVLCALRKLKYSVSSGPDGIPSAVLKKCSITLITPLVKLFNISLRRGVFPTNWKVSFMSPIYKKGDKCSIANYRGITSLCACSKVFEIVVNNALFESCKNYISSAQHGFYPKRSVNTNLVEYSSICIRSMDAGLQVDAIYTDFKAAFDRVNHEILVNKLERLGVSSAIVRWLRSYLSGRSMKVRIGCSNSDSFVVPSGVPQGSNLGPLLFSLFVNDVMYVVPTGHRICYADDMKFYMIISSMEDCVALQKLLDCFEDWSKRNCLVLCVEKCSTISFSRSNHPYNYTYTLCGQQLERLNEVTDLGVILDTKLTFRSHLECTIAKANRQLGFILRMADGFNDPLCLKSLYCALVRSILESSAVVWCPYNRTWIERIEAIQRKFVRIALRNLPWRDARNLPPYENRCMLLGIDTLEKRRTMMQAVFVAKVLINEIDSPALLSDMNIYVPERALRRRDFLYLQPRNSRYGQHDPIRIMALRFNEVFEHFDFNIPITSFANQLSRVNLVL